MVTALELFTRPTPIERAARLAETIGLDAARLWIKRDDLIGLGAGGNKARKLEITMAAALASGTDTVVTTGAPQSNHARLTAAAAARCGLRSVLVLRGAAPERPEGNLLLDRLFGAEIIFAGERDLAAVAAEQAQAREAHLIPFGGTSAQSALAYRDAGLEILEQVPDVGVVVVALGSGGTMAGLVAALGPDRVLGVDTGALPDARATVTDLLTEMGFAAGGLTIDHTQVGAGYQHLTPETRTAIELTARTEGIMLDPTYTGRAMAGLIAAATTRTLPPGPVVFLHSGGLPGLFAHPGLWA